MQRENGPHYSQRDDSRRLWHDILTNVPPEDVIDDPKALGAWEDSSICALILGRISSAIPSLEPYCVLSGMCGYFHTT